jgi:hypothetical protein
VYAIKAVYNGSSFQLEQPVPVKGTYEVVITFMRNLHQAHEDEDIFDFCNIFDQEDVDCIAGIINEREQSVQGRPEYDFS